MENSIARVLLTLVESGGAWGKKVLLEGLQRQTMKSCQNALRKREMERQMLLHLPSQVVTRTSMLDAFLYKSEDVRVGCHDTGSSNSMNSLDAPAALVNARAARARHFQANL